MGVKHQALGFACLWSAARAVENRPLFNGSLNCFTFGMVWLRSQSACAMQLFCETQIDRFECPCNYSLLRTYATLEAVRMKVAASS